MSAMQKHLVLLQKHRARNAKNLCTLPEKADDLRQVKRAGKTVPPDGLFAYGFVGQHGVDHLQHTGLTHMCFPLA